MSALSLFYYLVQLLYRVGTIWKHQSAVKKNSTDLTTSCKRRRFTSSIESDENSTRSVKFVPVCAYVCVRRWKVLINKSLDHLRGRSHAFWLRVARKPTSRSKQTNKRRTESSTRLPSRLFVFRLEPSTSFGVLTLFNVHVTTRMTIVFIFLLYIRKSNIG